MSATHDEPTSDSVGESRNTPWKWVGISVAIGILIVAALWWWLPGHLTAKYSAVGQKGSFGDIYGSVTSLFTGITFALLMGTIVGQLIELRAQRTELALQRVQLQGQNDTSKQQRFENTFFQLLRVHVDIVSALTMPVVDPGSDPRVYGGTAIERGRRCLWQKRRQLKHKFDGTYPGLEDARKDEGDAHELTLNLICEEVLHDPEVEPHLAHYFRQLYHIIKFVDESEIEDKRRYTDFVQAQMDNDELVLLAYNGLNERGENFKSLIEKYGLLENLAPGSFFHTEHFRLYERGAFGNKEYNHSINFL